MFMEKCANCGVIHYPRQSPAVYIGKRYFCKPSCHKRYHEKANLEGEASQ